MKYLLLVLSLTAYGQATINAPAVTLDATGAAATIAWMGSQNTGVETTLQSSINASTTTVVLVSGNGIGNSAAIIIGTEHMQITAKTGSTYTVTRGVNGTTAALHTAGDQVRELKYKTLNALGKSIMVASIKQIVESYGSINDGVVAAQAAKVAAIEASVQ